MPIFRSLFCASALFMAGANDPGCGHAPAPSPAPELPPPPPCIDNRCAERPTKLKCVEWTSSSCGTWNIIYENNCVCHEWGPREPKPDGGTL